MSFCLTRNQNFTQRISPLYQIKCYKIFYRNVFDAEFLTPEKTPCSHIFGQIAASFCRQRYASLFGTCFWVSFFSSHLEPLRLTWTFHELISSLQEHCMNNWHSIRGCIMIKSCLQCRFLKKKTFKKITSGHLNLYPNVI